MTTRTERVHGRTRVPRPTPPTPRPKAVANPTHKCPRHWAAREQVNYDYANVVETSARSVGRKFYVRLLAEHKSNFDERRLFQEEG